MGSESIVGKKQAATHYHLNNTRSVNKAWKKSHNSLPSKHCIGNESFFKKKATIHYHVDEPIKVLGGRLTGKQ